ncbi:hypothetical protein [Helicobacter canis]|uniref:hypothetical protein n=1 Tax=Helicobacter canis TaxID=29419 RepID=UPI000E0ECBD9|nr:hypothetical protein [Helicobacter canis]
MLAFLEFRLFYHLNFFLTFPKNRKAPTAPPQSVASLEFLESCCSQTNFTPRIHFLHLWHLTLESTFQKVDSSKGYFASAKLWIAGSFHSLAMTIKRDM